MEVFISDISARSHKFYSSEQCVQNVVEILTIHQPLHTTFTEYQSNLKELREKGGKEHVADILPSVNKEVYVMHIFISAALPFLQVACHFYFPPDLSSLDVNRCNPQ